jgi:hypothetical protein
MTLLERLQSGDQVSRDGPPAARTTDDEAVLLEPFEPSNVRRHQRRRRRLPGRDVGTTAKAKRLLVRSRIVDAPPLSRDPSDDPISGLHPALDGATDLDDIPDGDPVHHLRSRLDVASISVRPLDDQIHPARELVV